MKRWLWIGLWVISFISVTTAQETTESASAGKILEPSAYPLTVVVDSAFARALPSTDADPTTSLFEDDIVYAVGRNIDGTWFEVQRPFRPTSIGWLRFDLFTYSFNVGDLPITDLETGLIGEEAVIDTGVSVYILTESALRNAPNLNAEQIGIVPIQRTIPVLERNRAGNWLKINYLGQTGWVAEFLTSTRDDIMALPVSPEDTVALLPVEIIPPEVQRAQANRLLAYLTPLEQQATDTANFWGELQLGKTIPCNPTPANLQNFLVTQRDLFELPELRRATGRLNTAVNDLNSSVSTMQRCGIYTPTEISTAYAQAINARVIFRASIQVIENVLKNIIPG